MNTKAIRELLFESDRADHAWLQSMTLAFDRNASTDGIHSIESLIRTCYEEDNTLRDGYSRLAYFMMLKGEDLEQARYYFEKDSKHARQSWFAQLRHAECIAALGDLQTAASMVDRVYSTNPEAVDGHARYIWRVYWPLKEYATVINLLEDEHESGRLSPEWCLRLAQAKAAAGEFRQAFDLVSQAYKRDSSLTDGYARVAWEIYWPRKQYRKLARWMAKDLRDHRLSNLWQNNLVRVYRAWGRPLPDGMEHLCVSINNTFGDNLFRRIDQARFGDYRDNYNENRFGPLPDKTRETLKWKMRNICRHMGVMHPSWLTWPNDKAMTSWMALLPDLEWLYTRLADDESRKLMIDLIAYRIMGYRGVRLPLARTDYKRKRAALKSLSDPENYVVVNRSGSSKRRPYYDLNQLGYPIVGYTGNPITQFVIEQYAHRNAGIVAEPGDIVIDAGACYGETALYFGCKVGNDGQVHSFEFVPDNLDVFQKNLEINPEIAKRITIVKKALWDQSEQPVYVQDHGPSSKVSMKKRSGYDYHAETISIDDYVVKEGLPRIDFIKMDIEGAEEPALQGARNTIRDMHPKLAICLYHTPEAFVRLPRLIDSLCPGYEFYIKHSTIHHEETVLFAAVP